jgi:surface protein
MSKKYFQVTNFNIGKLDSNYFSVEDYLPPTTIKLGGDIVLYKKINFLGQTGTNRNWIKLGYICEPRAAHLPIFIWQKENSSVKKINLSQTGIYELQPHLIEIEGENIVFSPDLEAVAIPYDLAGNLINGATIDRDAYFSGLETLRTYDHYNWHYDCGFRNIARDNISTEEEILNIGSAIRIDDRTTNQKIYLYKEEYDPSEEATYQDGGSRPPRATLYFWSDAINICLPKNSSEFFKGEYHNSGKYYFDFTTEIDLSIFNFSKVENMERMFSFTGANAPTTVIIPSGIATHNVTSISYMFEEFWGTINDLNNLDTTNLDDMSNLFYNAILLNSSLNLSNWNVENVTKAIYTFHFKADNRRALSEIDISGWHLKNITDCDAGISNIFSWWHAMPEGESPITYQVLNKISANNLTIENNLDLTTIFQNANIVEMNNFYTTNTEISNLFMNGVSATEIQMNNLNAPEATKIEYVFGDTQYLGGDNHIASIQMKNANLPKVTEINHIFEQCKDLVNLELENWTISPTTIRGDLAHDCNFTEIDLSGWDFSKVRIMYTDLLSECLSLRTIYSPNAFFDRSYYIEHRTGDFDHCVLRNERVCAFPNYKTLKGQSYTDTGTGNIIYYGGIAPDLFPQICSTKPSAEGGGIK